MMMVQTISEKVINFYDLPLFSFFYNKEKKKTIENSRIRMSEWIGMKAPLKKKKDVKDNSICPSVTIFNVSKKNVIMAILSSVWVTIK